MPRIFSTVVLLGTLALPLATPSVHAQPAAEPVAAPSLIPDDAAWSLVLDLGKLRESNLVQGFYNRLDPGQQEKLTNLIDGLSNTAGINLTEELGRIVAFGNTFSPDDAGLALEIADAATNLEGLLLAAEGYTSHEYGNHIVHSALGKNGERRFFTAIVPQERTGGGVVVLSTGAAMAERMIDEVEQGRTLAAPDALTGDEFLRLSVSRLPREAFANQPRRSHIAGMIDSMQLVGSTGPQRTALALSLSLPSEARANQMLQLVNAGKAMVDMAAANDPDASKLNDLLAYVVVDQPAGEARVRITAACDTADLEGLLDMLERSGALRGLKLD